MVQKKNKKKNADSIAVPDHHAARALLETESECERREGQQWKKKNDGFFWMTLNIFETGNFIETKTVLKDAVFLYVVKTKRKNKVFGEERKR